MVAWPWIGSFRRRSARPPGNLAAGAAERRVVRCVEGRNAHALGNRRPDPRRLSCRAAADRRAFQRSGVAPRNQRVDRRADGASGDALHCQRMDPGAFRSWS